MLIPLGIFAFVPYALYEPLKIGEEKGGEYINEFGSDRYSVRLEDGQSYTIAVTTHSDLHLTLYISDSPYMLTGKTAETEGANDGVTMVYKAEKTDIFYIHVDADTAARGSYKIIINRGGGTASSFSDFFN